MIGKHKEIGMQTSGGKAEGARYLLCFKLKRIKGEGHESSSQISDGLQKRRRTVVFVADGKARSNSFILQ